MPKGNRNLKGGKRVSKGRLNTKSTGGARAFEKEKKQGRGFLIRTLVLLAVCGVIGFVVLARNLYQVQIVNRDYFETRTLSGQLRETQLRANRGRIYDSSGRVLAMSGPVENVFISPLEMYIHEQDVRFIAEGLSHILDVDVDFILERAGRTNSQYQVISHGIEQIEADRVRSFISEFGIRGVHFEPATRRVYPNNNLASQVLGFVGTENFGLDGLEHRFNETLTGVDGRMIRLTNARGTDLMHAGHGDYIPARDGSNLHLTLNLSVQYYVEKHLAQAIVDYNVQNGAICIAINPQTGELLAIAQYPNFDPNNFLQISNSQLERISSIEDEDEFLEAFRNAQFTQWRNRALTDTYEPGSVFKVLTWAVALEENAANLNSVFVCEGSIDVRVHEDVSTRNCWRRWGHGPQSLSEAMHNSCNVACINLALRIGSRTFYSYMDAFGLFDRTGVDNAAESRSIWWDERTFFDAGNQTQLASASFGQTFNITPMQMITSAAAVVNGGYLMQPYIVSHITGSDGSVTIVNEPTVVRQVISNETSAIMNTMLEGVVTMGTGRNARVMGYRIGGKTGTSENIVQIAQRHENDQSAKDYIVSFLGFAPADDPEIMILLLIDTPRPAPEIFISGGSIAAPVVGKMMADILPLSLGIMPTYSSDELRYTNVHVPRVLGMTVDEAITVLRDRGFEYDVIGNGATVESQLPARNAFVASGSRVIIYTEGEEPRNMVSVPYLGGMTYSQARQSLEGRGLFIRATGVPRTDSNALVSVQSIPVGRETMFGSVVEVTLINSQIVEQRSN